MKNITKFVLLLLISFGLPSFSYADTSEDELFPSMQVYKEVVVGGGKFSKWVILASITEYDEIRKQNSLQKS